MKEFKEFVEKFGHLFSRAELKEIETAWDDECRNAFILGIYDRRDFYSHEDREALIRWLDAHPDRWTLEFLETEGRRVSLREALAIPEDN